MSGAIQQWALENRQAYNATVTTASISPYIKLTSNNTLPACPAGGSYTLTTVSVQPVCNIGNSVTPAHVLE
ncbi:MAG: hypothetical protein WDM76_15020 [Limisphaerales bacterium]